jgi:hypothetical protein
LPIDVCSAWGHAHTDKRQTLLQQSHIVTESGKLSAGIYTPRNSALNTLDHDV